MQGLCIPHRKALEGRSSVSLSPAAFPAGLDEIDLLILHLCEEEGMAGDGFSGTRTGTALGQGGDPGLVALAAAYLKEGADYGTDHIP